jgi:hypothetical protein
VIRVEVGYEEVLDIRKTDGLNQLTLRSFPAIKQQLIAASAEKQ